MKYLDQEQLLTNLKLGKSVEQWLGAKKERGYVKLNWIRIDKEKGGEYTVAFIEVFDHGNEDFLDIYAFTPISPDEPFGVIKTFRSIFIFNRKIFM